MVLSPVAISSIRKKLMKFLPKVSASGIPFLIKPKLKLL